MTQLQASVQDAFLQTMLPEVGRAGVKLRYPLRFNCTCLLCKLAHSFQILCRCSHDLCIEATKVHILCKHDSFVCNAEYCTGQNQFTC